MSCISTALVVGGSIGGMNAAIALAQAGVQVDLVELADKAEGASIAFSGRAAETLVELGIYDETCATGMPVAPGNTAACLRDATTGEMMHPGPDRPTWPGAVNAVGVYRPAFLEASEAEARRLGVRVRKGVTYEHFVDGVAGVDVTFTDGESGRYDLLVAADGIGSKTRGIILPDANKPKFAGQLSIRWMAPGPAVQDEGWYGSDVGRLGFYYLPHQDLVYVPAVIDLPEWRWFSDADVHASFKALLDSMEAPAIRELRSRFNADSKLIGRPFEWILVDRPWHNGRTLLIGDAAHATTAHMGMGGGMALEDAVVLGQCIASEPTLQTALEAFMERRFDRVKMVVETSVKLSELEQRKAPRSENAALLTKAFAALGEPY